MKQGWGTPDREATDNSASVTLVPMKYVLIPLLLAAPVSAQDYNPRDTDTVPTAQELSEIILVHDLEYFDGGVSRYNTDGTYTWTYNPDNGGGVWYGHHEITDNVACITFVTGVERCDMFVQAGDRLTVLTADGQRFPIREIR